MHVYLRTADGKRGRYLGFKGTDNLHDWQTGEKVGKSLPPHWGFFRRLVHRNAHS